MSNAYKSRFNKALYTVAIILLLFAAALLILAYVYTGDTIRKGISIEQTDVSWLSVDEAKKMVTENLARSYNPQKITLVYGTRRWDVDLDEIGYSFMVDEAVQKAFNIGRKGNILNKLYNSVLLSINGMQLEIEENYDRCKLETILKKIKKECDSTGKNAEISYVNGQITFKREKLYRTLDIDRNIELVENHLMRRQFGDIELVVEERKPHIVYDDIKVINGIISQFGTRFNRSDTNRTDNIKLACSRINNTILLPGESFSMNEALGPRTHENGYKEAPIIFKNELVQGTGGGVCQVSSTLYNSVLLAGLDVIEREHHSIPLSYISPGRDATINEGSIDFKFVNNLDHPICIQAGVSGNKLNIGILGKKREDGVVIKLRTETLKVYNPKPDEIILDHTLQNGQKVVERKPVRGLRVALYREAYKNGKLMWREKLTEDYYKPIQGKVRVSSDLYTMFQSTAG